MELIFHSLINVAKKQRKVNYTSSSIVFVIVVTYVTTRTNKKKHKAFVTHNPSRKRWRRAIKLFTLSVFVCLSVTVLCQACLLHFFLTIPRSLFFQYGGVGPVSHGGGPGARCPTRHHQRGLRPSHRRGYPQVGGKDTWVALSSSLCLPLSHTSD